MTAGTFGTHARRSRPAFRWSAAPIIDGEIVGRSGGRPGGSAQRGAAGSRRAARRLTAVALVLAALLCTLALLAFPGA